MRGHVAKALAKAKRLVHVMQNPELKVADEAFRNDPHNFLLHQFENVIVCLRNGVDRPWTDFALDIRPSSLGPQAGRGLFVKGVQCYRFV